MRRLLFIIFALALPSTLAHAQGFSLYLTSTNTHFSNVQSGTSYSPTTTTYTNLFTDTWPPEIGAGITLNAIKSGPIRFGLDLRGSTNRGNTGADTAMAGPRVAVRLPIFHLQPYLAAEGGYVATRTPGTVVILPPGPGVPTNTSTTITNQYAGWEIFGGVDVPIIPHLNFRAVEMGGGKGYLANAGIQSVNLNNTSTQISLFSIDTGVVVHF